MFDYFDPALLDLADSSPTLAEAKLNQDVLPRFGAQPEPLATDPRDYLHEVDDERGAQTISLLRQLGYLRLADQKAKPGSVDRIYGAEIEQAWDDWTADYRANRSLPDGAANKVHIATETDHDAPEPDRLRRALKACASFEGEVTLRGWPQGNTGLASHVHAHRLRFFGLTAGPAYTSGMLQARFAGLELHQDPINALGDVPTLTQAISKRLQNQAIILGTAGTAKNSPPSGPLPLHGTHGRRVTDFPHPLTRDNITPLDTTDAAKAALNDFAIKLLQTRLWTLGYYPGAIDGKWSTFSHEALNNFIADYPDDAASPEVILNNQDGYATLLVSPVLDAIATHADVNTEPLERTHLDSALQALRAAAARHEDAIGLKQESNSTDRQAHEAWQQLQSLTQAHATSLAKAVPQPGRYEGDDYLQTVGDNPARQVNHGWRGVFTAFGRLLTKMVNGVREVIRWADTWLSDFATGVIKAVKQALKTGLGYAHQILAYIKDTARVAMRVTGLAVARLRAWLEGMPVITHNNTTAVATRWQMDFDTLLIVSADAPPDLVEQHVRILDWMGRSFSLLVRVGLALLRLLLAAALNWLLFAWRAIALIREIIDDARDPLFDELLAKDATI